MRQKRNTKTVGMDATAEDLRMIEMLKTRLRRRSNADLLRFLIQQEAERVTAPVMLPVPLITPTPKINPTIPMAEVKV